MTSKRQLTVGLLLVISMALANSLFAQQSTIELITPESSLTLTLGLDPLASSGIDPDLGEVQFPPFPPSGTFDARFTSSLLQGVELGSGTRTDLRNGGGDFRGTVLHELTVQRGASGEMAILPVFPEGVEARISDTFGGIVYAIDLSSQDQVTLPSQLDRYFVAVTYRGNNSAPEVESTSLSTSEDSSATALLSVSDANGDATTLRIDSGPEHGTASIAGVEVTYSPALNFNGLDSLSVVASDGFEESGTAWVRISISPVNDPPTVAQLQSPGPGIQWLVGGEPSDTYVVTWFSSADVDGDAVTYKWVLADSDRLRLEISPAGGTSIAVSVDSLASALDRIGASPGDVTPAEHWIEASDGSATTIGDPSEVSLYRGSVTSTAEGPRVSDADLAVAPNPAADSFVVFFEPCKTVCQYRISDLLGRQIERGEISHGAELVSSRWPTGVYVLTVRADRLVPRSILVVVQ
jgi:Bacterial Ig domain